MIGYDTDNADSKPVFQLMDPAGKADGPVAPQGVLAHTAGPQGVQIGVQIRHAVVEIMIAQGHIVVSAAIHDLSKATGVLLRIMAERPERRPLQHIAPVYDEGISVLLKTVGALEKAQLPLLRAAVIRGIDERVKVGGKINLQRLFFHTLTPASASCESWRRSIQ